MFVTSQRWAARHGDTVALLLDGGQPLGQFDLWGVTIGRRMTHMMQQVVSLSQMSSIPNGVRYDLSAALGFGAVLEWTHEDNSAWSHFETTPGELAHLTGGLALTKAILDEVPPQMPASLTWQHQLTFPAGTTCVYQPPLTQAEIDEGAVRPPAIVGSYAVRDASGVKISHIPRPIAWDRDHIEHVWGEIEIVGGLATVSFPKNLLRRLAEPVTFYGLDTLGVTGEGGTQTSLVQANYSAVGPWPMGADGTATAVWTYGNANYSGANYNVGITPGIFDDDASYPDAKQADGTTIDCNKVLKFWESAISAALSNGTSYWVAIGRSAGSNDPNNREFYIYYDAGSYMYEYDVDYGSVTTHPNPYPAAGMTERTSRDYSVYIEYTAGGGATLLALLPNMVGNVGHRMLGGMQL